MVCAAVSTKGFRWKGVGALATGTLRGVTNAGTHRRPAFDDCQRCDNPGVMEGLHARDAIPARAIGG